MNINLIGNIFGSSGYAAHTRGLFNALYELEPSIYLSTPLKDNWMLAVNDAELNAISNKHFRDGVTVQIGLPDFWESVKTEECKLFYGFCVWEGDSVPPRWINIFRRVHRVLVPSNHVKQAIFNTCTGEEWQDIEQKVVIIPHGVNVMKFQPQPKPEGRPFTFMANKGWAGGNKDRGGLQFVLRAFAEEFKKDEPVECVVKINPAYFPQGFNLDAALDALGLPKERPIIHINAQEVDYASMPKAYHAGDVFLNPTMGEAFSIPCAEAMACGLPVITTDFGGQTDYVNAENGWLVGYKLQEVTHDVMYEGIRWALPDMKELKSTMRYAYEHPEEVQLKAEKARDTILENYQWKHSANKLLALMKQDMEAYDGKK